DDNAGSLFDSGLIKKGAEFKFTFANAGTFNYFCTVHPWMAGQVIVGAASTTPSANTTTTTPTPANTTAVPEFGPVASIVLAIAVMSMVVFVAKTRGIPKF
ncbi:MAG TPA: plastocyanin/azurin family copper-binding protein, partial [Candidatus Nitrosotalea sp.]|nr:plastocyanin/azurin family copper-binding protein [Candidatus Nitrosotalea sp.]